MPGVSNQRARRLVGSSTIQMRLAIAFLLVALVSVGLVGSLSLIFGERDLSSLAAQRRQDVIRALLIETAAAHHAGTWTATDLEQVRAIARSAGAEVAVLDAVDQLVTATATDPRDDRHATRAPIMDQGQRIGTLVVEFGDGGIQGAAAGLRRSFALAVAIASALACLLALSVGTVAARRLTRPLVRLIGTARAVAAGDRTARVGPVDAAPEIRELTATVDAMTDTLVRQEQLHRDLVADVAHELRTPIAVLQAECEAMLDQITEPTAAEISSLHDEVLRLGRLVDDLQTLASADAAALHLVMHRTDLAAIVDEAADALASHFAEAGLVLRRDLAPAMVVGDPPRLRQIVLNLLTNAAKFTPAGGEVTVTVRTAAGRAALEVRDTGIGIGAAELPQIFDRFWRGRRGSGAAGTGIGLAIVAELTRAHRGSIEVRSDVGTGTTMTVFLPSAD
jgi:two-component system sensor histidine kinase BaeS